MSGWIYAVQVEDGSFLASTAVCAEHYYLTPAQCSSPIPAHFIGAGPMTCGFCERAK